MKLLQVGGQTKHLRTSKVLCILLERVVRWNSPIGKDKKGRAMRKSYAKSLNMADGKTRKEYEAEKMKQKEKEELKKMMEKREREKEKRKKVQGRG